MFKKAYKIASKFTHPLIIGIRFFDGTMDSGIGTFVILNDEGWLMTAGHMMHPSILAVQHKKEIDRYRAEQDKINQNSTLSMGQKKNQLKKLVSNKKWIEQYALWIGTQKTMIEKQHVYVEQDIAFIKIDPKYVANLKDFPAIKAPTDDDIGASVCKLGFPFHPVNATFDEEKKQFVIPANLFPIPRFPIDGMYTRNLKTGRSKDDTYDILYLETSTPGLKGQSGGPIYDTDGNIMAIQSRNMTIPLGFKGRVENNGKWVEENQFMNVGLGVHGKMIVKFLDELGIKYNRAEG